jgi:MFS transporter, UMF1 family
VTQPIPPILADAETQPRRSAVAAWVGYDVGNTIWSMGVVSIGFPLFVSATVGAERADRVVGVITAVSMGVIFIFSPLLGALTDRSRRRMPFLVVATLGCVVATLGMGHAGAFWISAACFVLANIAFQAGSQFYDSLLPAVSTEENRGRISGLGVGLGYVGSYIAIALSFVLGGMEWGWRFTGPALGFLAMAVPCFLLVREPINPRAMGFHVRTVTESFRQVVATFKSARQYRDLFRFLIARMLYTDAINTVIGIMTLFAANVAMHAAATPDRSAAEGAAKVVMLVAITTAIAGGLVIGRFLDRVGPKPTLVVVLSCWVGVLLFAAIIGLAGLPFWTMYVLALLTGVAFGGVWTSDRPLLMQLCPAERLGEFFGLYGMVGRFAAILGPVIWGGVSWAGQSIFALTALQAQGVGLLVLACVLGSGLWLLRGVNVQAGGYSNLKTPLPSP